MTRTKRLATLARKSLTFNLSAPFGSPFDTSLSNAGQELPSVPLSIGQLYESAAPAQAVVGTLARGVGRSTFRVVYAAPDGDRQVRDTRLADALNDPELKAELASDLSVFGRCFAAIAGEEFIRLPADTTEVMVNGIQVVGFRNNGREFATTEVAFARHYSPLTTKMARGGSPLEAVRPELEEYLAAYSEMRALAAGASTIVRRGLDAPEWTEKASERFEEGWRSRLKRGGSPVLEDGMELAQIPRPAAFVETRRQAFDATCSVFSVPPAMVAAADSDRNADSAARSFAVDAVQPVGDMIAAAMTRVAVPHFYSDPARIVVRCNVDDLGRDRFTQRMAAYRLALGKDSTESIFSPDELRAMEGYGPRSNG